MENQPQYPQNPQQPSYPPVQPPYPTPRQPEWQASMQPQAPMYAPPPPPQPKRRGRGCLIGGIVAVVVIAAIVVISMAASGGKASTTTSTGGTSTSANATQPTADTGNASTTHKIGDVVTLDGWQVTVNGAKVSKGGEFDTPQKAGDVYLEINVTIVNLTSQPQTFSSDLAFTVKDSTGQSYNQTIVSNAPATPDGTVQKNARLRGTVAYEIPPSLHSFSFLFTPDFISTDQAVWNLAV